MSFWKKTRRTRPNRRRLHSESLENRVLMAADLSLGSDVAFNPQPEPPRILEVQVRTEVQTTTSDFDELMFNPQPEPPRIRLYR